MGGYRKDRRVSWPWRSERELASEVDEELHFHLEERVRELEARGHSAQAARAQAQREFGDLADARSYMITVDRHRQARVRRGDLIESVLQDVRFGMRGLLRDRGFALIAVLTLALGIGANSAIFSLVDGVLLRALPYARPEELIAVSAEHSFMRAEYALARERMRTVASLGGYQRGIAIAISGEGEAERLVGALVSADLLRTLEVAPLGRTFERIDERLGSPRVALISHRLWTQRFGGQRSAIGRTIMINGVSQQIVGVMPKGFAFPDAKTDFWLPAIIDAADRPTFWGIGGMRAVGRLRAGASAADAQRELRGLGEAMRLANPYWTPNAPYRADGIVIPLQEAVVGDSRSLLLVLLGAVVLVWLIACANVGNLVLARGLARERELTVRAALGAGRGRLIRQLVTESLTLSLLGGALGLGLGWIVLRLLVPHLPADLPRLDEIRLDRRVLGFTFGASLLAGIGFGLMPALRVIGSRLGGSIGHGARTGASARHRRLSSGVVVAEIALAVVLSTAAGLLVRSLHNLSEVDTGFATQHAFSARLSPPAGLYGEPARRLAFYEEVLGRVRGVPAVENVALTGQLPFDGESNLTASAVEFVTTDPNNLPMFEFRAVTPEFFRTMQIPLIEGRGFTETDRAGALPVAIVDRTTAERFWPGQSPLGKRLGRPWLREWRTVVGMVGSVRNNRLKEAITPGYYVPLAQEPGSHARIVVRSAAEAAAVNAVVRSVVREVDPAVPVSDLHTLDELVSDAAARERAATFLIGAFASLAMLLGAVGLYGVLSYAVTQRRRELSVRSALGADRHNLLRLVLREGLALGAIGLVIGLPCAALAGRALSSLLYRVQPADVVNLLVVGLLMGATSILASLVPALRAVRVQPADALRA